jgi:hypothetical protein
MKPHVEARSVPITLLDGKPRHVYLGFNALNTLVEKLGVDIMNAQTTITTAGGPEMLKTIRAILWAGLIHEDEMLTIEDAGDLIEFSKLDEITNAVLKALALSFKSGGELKNAEKPVTETSPSTDPASSEQAKEQPTP